MAILKYLFDEAELKKQGMQDRQFVKQLLLLDIYSKAIQRTTPQR